jgi:uncharacterized membrane protein
MQGLEWLNFSVLDWLSCLVFFLCWVGYTRYAITAGKSKPNLSSALHLQREQWMLNALSLNRLETPRDILSIGMFERSVAFFASTSILILAGLLTVLGSSEKVATVLASVHFVNDVVVEQIQVKLLLLILIFVHAFFKFSWSMRSYGFMVTTLGAAPLHFAKESCDNPVPSKDALEWANSSAKIVSSASQHFNLGLRAYYFALAILTWFIHPILFILSSICVVAVLYRRDFKSYALGNLEQHNNAIKRRALLDEADE